MCKKHLYLSWAVCKKASFHIYGWDTWKASIIVTAKSGVLYLQLHYNLLTDSKPAQFHKTCLLTNINPSRPCHRQVDKLGTFERNAEICAETTYLKVLSSSTHQPSGSLEVEKLKQNSLIIAFMRQNDLCTADLILISILPSSMDEGNWQDIHLRKISTQMKLWIWVFAFVERSEQSEENWQKLDCVQAFTRRR